VVMSHLKSYFLYELHVDLGKLDKLKEFLKKVGGIFNNGIFLCFFWLLLETEKTKKAPTLATEYILAYLKASFPDNSCLVKQLITAFVYYRDLKMFEVTSIKCADITKVP